MLLTSLEHRFSRYVSPFCLLGFGRLYQAAFMQYLQGLSIDPCKGSMVVTQVLTATAMFSDDNLQVLIASLRPVIRYQWHC